MTTPVTITCRANEAHQFEANASVTKDEVMAHCPDCGAKTDSHYRMDEPCPVCDDE